MADFITNLKVADLVINSFLMPVFIWIYHFFAVRGKTTKNEIKELKRELSLESEKRKDSDQRNKDRIKDLESKVEHLATKEDFKEIEIAISRFSEQFKSLSAQLKQNASTTKEIQRHLMDKKI